MIKIRSSLMLAGALLAALTLSACATPAETHHPGSTTTPDAAREFNAADIEFAQMMIPHHEGAIGMAQSIRNKEGIDPQVTDLAERVQAAQGPEIDQLNHMLEAWGADTGMDHDMDDMMPEDDMVALEAASGAEASKLFLEQMIVHHQGAIDMAQAELDDGTNAEAQAMAQEIIDAQEAEIAEMQEILATL